MEQLSKLMLFESSAGYNGELISLDDYISRCTPEQKHIYYLVAPNREAALQSPYYETFKRHKKEVLFLYNTIDDFVMSNMKEFSGTVSSYAMCYVKVANCVVYIIFLFIVYDFVGLWLLLASK